MKKTEIDEVTDEGGDAISKIVAPKPSPIAKAFNDLESDLERLGSHGKELVQPHIDKLKKLTKV